VKTFVTDPIPKYVSPFGTLPLRARVVPNPTTLLPFSVTTPTTSPGMRSAGETARSTSLVADFESSATISSRLAACKAKEGAGVPGSAPEDSLLLASEFADRSGTGRISFEELAHAVAVRKKERAAEVLKFDIMSGNLPESVKCLLLYISDVLNCP
jgi:hypothetical protein